MKRIFRYINLKPTNEGRWHIFRIAVLLSMVLIGVPTQSRQVPVARAAAIPGWEYANPMNEARCCFTATILKSGKLFVAGGHGAHDPAIASTEVYDPALDTWTLMAPLLEARQQHSATLLPDGRVLVAGGVISDSSTVKATAEIYDPKTNTWSVTGQLHAARANQFDLLLPDGRVLIGGGYTSTGSLNSTEIYNPTTGKWTAGAPIPWSAQQQTATLLNDGTVLVTGGWDGFETDKAALYKPTLNTWQPIESMHFGRSAHSANLLHDGRVLVTGFFRLQADIYDPTTQSWSLSAPAKVGRLGDAASLLPDGKVLVSGGRTDWSGPVVDSTEIYNPETNEWALGPRMQETLEGHESITLPNNYLVVLGGSQNDAVFSTVERFGPLDLPLVCTPSSVVILENDTCTIALIFKTIDANSSRFSATSVSDDLNLIPNTNLVIQRAGTSRTLTITPAKTHAQIEPIHRGTTIITIHATDGAKSETLQYQVHIVPPPWLVMLYLNGDDGFDNDRDAPGFESIAPAINRLIQQKLPEMTELTNNYNPAIRLVAVADLHHQKGDSQVFVLDPSGLIDVTSQLIVDQSRWPGFTNELNTADPSTVRGFVNWARKTYPDSTYSFLSMVDHGGGWAPDLNGPGGQPRGIAVGQAGGWRGMSVDYTGDGSNPSTKGQSMSTKDTHRALQGLGINVIFFDACFMGMLESAYEIRDDADYMIAGENELFADFPYDDYFSGTRFNATTTPRELSISIVQRYNASVNKQLNPFTIAAIDLHQLRAGSTSNLAQRVDILAARILAELPLGTAAIPETNTLLQALQQAYEASQKFDYDSSLKLDTDREGYVDLIDFVVQLRNSGTLPETLRTAAQDVENVIRGTADPVVLDVQAIRKGTYKNNPMDLAHANGVSIYLPLGEQDNRPTYVDPNNPGCPASPEPQLPYYNDPTQLAFREDYPNWAALLMRLQNNVTVIRAPISPGCSATHALANDVSITIDERPFVSPRPLKVATGQSGLVIYMPFIAR